MPSFNKVILAGNLTRDPEMRYTPKGTAVANVDIAINRTWKDESGQQREEVTFVSCAAFGRTAEVISQYLQKGKPILVEGRLKLDQWDDKQTNQKRSKLSVVIESFQFLDSGGGDGGQRQERQPSQPRQAGGRFDNMRQAARPAAPPANDDMPPDDDDDVPF